MVEDTSSFIAGQERIEPIQSSTRILVFLKPASSVPANWQRFGQWTVAGFGNCYFWSHDPANVDSLRAMAKKALALRKSWDAARNLPDKQQRAEALWPYLWNYNQSCYKQTEAALQEIGAIAGDYIATIWRKSDDLNPVFSWAGQAAPCRLEQVRTDAGVFHRSPLASKHL